MSDLTTWNVEDEKFWEEEGKKIANRNLWISIPSLLCGFAVWICWSVITVQMLNLGFPFTESELFTLSAIAGLSGATLRIPSTFFIRIAGGRNTIFFTTALLLIPAFGTGVALSNIHTPLWVFQLFAFLAGIGGGNFASSMSNISFFFPKKNQGLSLGLNAGLGNFGVTAMQILVPLVMTFSLFGPFGGEPMVLKTGSFTYIQNAGFVWILFLIPLVVAGWFGMHNIQTEHVSPGIGSPFAAFTKITGMLLIGFLTAGIGVWLVLSKEIGGLGWNKWLVLPGVIFATVFLLKQLPGEIKNSLTRQYQIFNNKHTWAMTIIYTLTFGSFIGYSAALPLAIKVIFGFSHMQNSLGVWQHVANPEGPNVLMYAWMGPFIGALVRPIGGWIADKVGGALVTQIISVVMVACALGAAYYMHAAYQSATPQDYFAPFFSLFLVLFAASGLGNGSTFKTVAAVFNKEQAGPVLGWTSAVAAYGAFIIPIVFGEQIKGGTPEHALYGFAAFYILCVFLNGWFYLRPHAYVKNP